MNTKYACKRILAYLIDYALIASPMLLLSAIAQLFFSLPVEELGLSYFFYVMGFYAIAFVPASIVLGLTTGLLGWTPGKLIFSLRVRQRSGPKVGILNGIMRELLKSFFLSFFFGMIYALWGLFERGGTFYDDWFDCEVEDRKPWGRTETQRRWRQQMK